MTDADAPAPLPADELSKLLALVRALPEEQRHEVAKAAGVACWYPWHRQGFGRPRE